MIAWYKQGHPASCVAACLRIVLSSFGQLCQEIEIRRLLGNPRVGVTLRVAAIKLLEAGTIAELHEDWGIDDLRDCLRAGWNPIVGLERRFFGYPDASHAVVLVAMRSSEVKALDPLIGPEPQSYQATTFEAAWKSAGQEALVLMAPWRS